MAMDVLAKRKVDFMPAREGLSAETLIREIQPRVLLTGTSENPDTLGLRLIDAARQAEIPSAAFVDAAMNASYRFRQRSTDALASAPDWILVPDVWTQDEFVRIGARADRVIVCGHPHYDYVLNLFKTWTDIDREAMRKKLLPGLAKGRQVLIFLSEGSERVPLLQPVPLEEYVMRGRGLRKGRTEIIMEEFLDAVGTLPQRPYLVLRLHPKDHGDDFKEYGDEFDCIDQTSPPLELVYCADLVVGMTSMLLLEAALLGRRTLSIVPRELEKEWLPTIRQGITPCVTNRADLAVTLKGLVQKSGVVEHRPFIAEGALTHLLEFMERVCNHG
ncbi:MAG: hypothetical protein AB2L22_15505 [Syntrophales bacterium]